MAIAAKEASRHQGNPVKLYLFKGADPALESMLQSVTMIPGATEFGYGTTKVSDSTTGYPKNYFAGQGVSDFEASLNDLLAVAPKLKHVSLVVAWHGDDLRCGICKIQPRVESTTGSTTPYAWNVGGVTRGSAIAVSQIDDKPAIGGAPSDRSVFEAITLLKSRGLRVTLYPFIVMDIPEDNELPNNFGGDGQPAYPWRGRITCTPAPGQPGTVDGTDTAINRVQSFFGSAEVADFSFDATNKVVEYDGTPDWKLRYFILHMATIADAAGVDDFLIGSELVGLTKIRDGSGNYPAVERLIDLAGMCRTILGEDVRISYAADWSEYHSHNDGTDLRFHLDALWADDNIDFVGIDNYFPLSDWRDGYTHLDWQAGYTSIHDPFYLKANIEGGEYFDWYYADSDDRDDQIRTPITDGAYNEPWVFRQKDIRSWWNEEHFDRIAGVKAISATDWVPGSKPIVFTEIGCPAVNKGSNQPNTFVDAKSSDSALPYYSNGRPDAAIMRTFVEASLDYWREGGPNNDDGMIDAETMSVWTWDARPYPAFPVRTEIFGDAANWKQGHWLTGRVREGRSFETGSFGPYAFNNGEVPITRAGITYLPWPIDNSDITASGTLDKSDITVTMAAGSTMDQEFVGYPPSQVINLTIFQGHMDDAPSLSDYPAQWLGRVSGPDYRDSEVTFNCVPVSTSIQRPGLRQNYQLGCQNVLYGSKCRANKANATISREVDSFERNQITVTSAVTVNRLKYRGGLVEWVAASGRREVRTLTNISESGLILTVRGTLRGIADGLGITLTLGCNRLRDDCGTLHNNILNYGGQPFIPLENPLSNKNQFY